MADLILTTDDVDELCHVGSAVFSPHRLRYRGAGAQLAAADLAGIAIVSMRYRGEALVQVPDELGYYAVHLPVSGHGIVRLGDGEIVTDASRGVVFNPDDRPDMRWSPDLHQHGVRVPAAVLRRHATALIGHAPAVALRFEHAGAVGWDGATRLLGAALARRSIDSLPSSASARLEEMFLTALLYAQPNSWTPSLLGTERPASRSSAARARDLVESDPAVDWTVASLASAVGVSVRALQEGFRRDFDASPATCIRDARLQLAHALLAEADGHATVADIAARSGFGHLGRFAALHRERYGVAPSEMLRRARGAAARER